MSDVHSLIRRNEEKLFSEWRKELNDYGKVFIPDGVVVPEKWVNANNRVIFLLKEVNGGESEWDERDYLENYNTNPLYIKTHSPTISVLIQWIYAFDNDIELEWDKLLSQIDNTETQTKLLQQIALVNVKKVPGGGTVDGEKFDQYWREKKNIDNLKKQFENYFSSDAPPDYIVCGATSWFYEEIFKNEKLKWEQTSRGIRYCKHRNTIVIDYCHPQARIASNIKYYALFDALQEIRERYKN